MFQSPQPPPLELILTTLLNELAVFPDNFALVLDDYHVIENPTIQIGLNLPPETMAALMARTEGWIAGLQLAALSMQGRDDLNGFVEAFTGSHRFILDYLTDEVFQRQPLITTPNSPEFCFAFQPLFFQNKPLTTFVVARLHSVWTKADLIQCF